MLEKLMLFTDGSVHVQTGIGYGAYLSVTNMETPLDLLKGKIKVVRFEATSSTKLELQILLHALSTIPESVQKIEIYTDSQNILSLLQRRKRLEQIHFLSNGNKPLNNAALYRDFFRVVNQFHCDFIKVKGHKKMNQKDEFERIFTLVDRASRNALRREIRNQNENKKIQ